MKRQLVSILAASVLALLGSAISAGAQTVVGSVSLGSQPAAQVAVNPNTGRVYVAGGYAQNQLAVVNVSDVTHPIVVTTISGPVGGSGVTVNSNTNFFYTSDGFSGQVLKYDGATNTLLATASIGACPGAFDIDPATNLVYVTRQCAAGGPPRFVDPLFVLDGGTLATIGNNLGTGGVVGFPKVNTATGVVYACSSGGDDVWGPSPTFTPITILTAGCVSAVNPVTNRLYLQSGSDIQVLDGGTNSLVATIAGVNAGPAGVNTTLNRVYAVDSADQVVKVIDGATNMVVASFSLGPGVSPGALAVDSGKNFVYVAGAVSGSATLFVIRDTANQPPVVSLSPTSLNFGSQQVGTTSAAQTVTLTNTGGSTLNFSSVTITGTNSSDFTDATCGTSLAAGANCTLSVTFKPTATGPRNAFLTITDDAVDSPQKVGLSGIGTAPAVTLSATSLTFGSQVVGTTSGAQTLTLTNSGSATLTISSFAFGGDFGPGPTNTCGSSVAALANCTISVTFSPTATGPRTGALTIADNAADSPQSISLSGTGAPAATTTSISAPIVTYNANGAVTVTVTSSLGTVTGNVSLVVDGGAPITQALSGGSTVFTLTSPNAGDHSLMASYTAQGNFDSSSATGTLHVNKATPTITWANPADIVYGTPLGSTQLNATASFNGSPLPGSFAYTPPTATVLGVGAGQVLSVSFTPTDTTNFNNNTATVQINVAPASLTITANNASKILDASNPSFTATYSGFVLGQDPSVLSGTLSCTSTATTTSPVGSYPIACSGLSSPNYAINYVPGTLTVLYAPAGTLCYGDVGHSILPPISALGMSVFKQGSTVPAKFRVCNANGVSNGTPGVVSSFRLTQTIAGTVTDVDEPVGSTNPDTAFRFDPVAQQWIFNTSTSSLAAGATYVFTISLNDGTVISFQYGLK